MSVSPSSPLSHLLSAPESLSSAFLLIQLPGQPIEYWECHSWMEAERISDLEGEEGFIFAPFSSRRGHAIYLLRPEKVSVLDPQDFSSHVTKNPPLAQEITSMPEHEPPPSLYRSRFEIFHSAVTCGQFSKLVLSRYECYPLSCDCSAMDLFVRLLNLESSGTKYFLFIPKLGCWLGATPEILLQSSAAGSSVMALAGTKPSTDCTPLQDAATIFGSKNIREHQIVVEHLHDILKAEGFPVLDETQTILSSYAVGHLCTRIKFGLSGKGRLSKLVERLHPTPAICGSPADETEVFINENEGYERSYYAGYLGYWHYEGKTDLYVNLRSASISSENKGEVIACLYAGGGIMPDSDCETEWQETRLKIQLMRTLFAPFSSPQSTHPR